MYEVWGLVLCGGSSTRMGVDKAQINYHGVTQQKYIYDLLRDITPNVFVSQKTGQFVEKGLQSLEDRYKIESPINGILSAFKLNPQVAWLVIAVDMPLVTGGVVKTLLRSRATDKMATCFESTDGLPHPLLTIYEPTAAPLLEKHAKNSISPRKFLMQNNIKIITHADNDFLRNANTQEEHQELLSFLGKK